MRRISRLMVFMKIGKIARGTIQYMDDINLSLIRIVQREKCRAPLQREVRRI